MRTQRTRSRRIKWLAIVFILLAVLLVLYKICISIKPPLEDTKESEQLKRESPYKDFYTCDDSWLKKNEFGLWEMYLEGNNLELGLKNGILAEELIHDQEEAFITQLREMVPSEFYLNFLKNIVVWMNRNLDQYIPEEFLSEIYGVSLKASDEYSFIGPAYQRMLNYHAAHDIGHALQNMNLVACTAFGVHGSRSKDGGPLVGRNFDFSMGDDFARDKIVAFYKPDSGYSFVSITWGGMIGTVSGMNDQGLTVSLNAAKSSIPTSAKTPVSILARQILQYASTIEEAYELAGQASTFVAESFLISSARDNNTVVIEKSPDELSLYDTDSEELILTNHFQSDAFKNSELTKKNKSEGSSVYRWERTKELLDREEKHDELTVVKILRDQSGKGDSSIGMGNEKTINQLIAHHSIVFAPRRLKIWISSFPYQLGSYICYDLNKVFSDSLDIYADVFSVEDNIGEDPFLTSQTFLNWKEYKTETSKLEAMIDNKEIEEIGKQDLHAYTQLNQDYYYPYFIAGECHRLRGNHIMAAKMYELSLSKEIPREVDRNRVIKAKDSLKEQ
jgi:isopenicillin-N N-acyltransferase-like protein